MAASAKQQALVFGHSFVRHFSECTDNSQPNDLFRRNLQLVYKGEVKIFGTGGCAVDKTICFDLNSIRGTTPNVVVLGMGSNNACKKDSDVETIALLLVASRYQPTQN